MHLKSYFCEYGNDYYDDDYYKDDDADADEDDDNYYNDYYYSGPDTCPSTTCNGTSIPRTPLLPSTVNVNNTDKSCLYLLQICILLCVLVVLSVVA